MHTSFEFSKPAHWIVNSLFSMKNCILPSTLAGLALLSGCAAGPDYVRPVASLPTTFVESVRSSGADKAAHNPQEPALLTIAGEPAQRIVMASDIPSQWWELFRSEALNSLIQDSLKNNPNILAAQAALRAAQENTAAQSDTDLPTVTASFTPTRQRISNALSSPAGNNASIYNLHTAQLSISYTPDVFGANHRLTESLQAQADTLHYQLQATYLTLTSNLVNAAIQEAALRGQLNALEAIVASQKKLLVMVERQRVLGNASELDLATQQAALAAAEANVPGIQKQLALERDQIKMLAGRFPDDSRTPQFELSSLHLPEEIPLTLPSLLVEQRPDVLAAEAQLRAANATVGNAIANRLPNITLGVNALGSTAYQLSDLFKSGTLFWNLAGSITQPIFDGGVLRHKQYSAQAAYDQAAAQYRATVLAAFQNVADSLQALDSDTHALQAAIKSEQAATRLLTIMQRQLALGDISPLSLLSTEQNAQQAQLALVQAKANRYADTVALFQALGGGWWNKQK